MSEGNGIGGRRVTRSIHVQENRRAGGGKTTSERVSEPETFHRALAKPNTTSTSEGGVQDEYKSSVAVQDDA